MLLSRRQANFHDTSRWRWSRFGSGQQLEKMRHVCSGDFWRYSRSLQIWQNNKIMQLVFFIIFNRISFWEIVNISFFVANTSGNIEKSLCECDLELAKTIRPMKIPNRPLTESECTLVPQSRRQKCCFNQKKNLFKIYNSDISCCSDIGTIESLGTC